MNLNLLPERLVVIHGDRKLMCSKRNVSESVWGYLRRFAVQQDRGIGRLGFDRKRGHILNLFELQTDIGIHSFVSLDILLDRLIVLEVGRKLVGTIRNVSEYIWRYLGRLSVQQKGGAGRLR